MLRTTGIGCHLGSAYSGALSYADDITLLCPSVRGLNEMIVLLLLYIFIRTRCESSQRYISKT